MNFFTTSIATLCLVWSELNKVQCGKTDSNFYRAQAPNFEYKSRHKGHKESGSKSIAKAMLDLKHKHRNASLGHLLLGYKDVVDSLSRIRGYKLGHLRSYRFLSETSSRYLPTEYKGLQWPKLRHGDRHGDRRNITKSKRRIPMSLTFKNNKRVNQNVSIDENTKQCSCSIEAEVEELSPYSIKSHLQKLVQFFPDANITEEVIGKTGSYNDIVMLKVTQHKDMVSKFFRTNDKYVEEVAQKKIIFIVHGLSVMGWHKLPCLHNEEKFARLARYYFKHLDKFDIFLVPMANPDGVAMPNTLWNKNASPQKACSGVALDRNFNVAWNMTKQVCSCSQQYPGESSLSEPETLAIDEVFHFYSRKIVAYIHVHAGTYDADVFKGDAVLYPRGYTDQSDDDKYVDLKGEIDEAMRNANFQVLSVTVDTLYNWYGKVAGSSVDYATSVYGIPYAMEFAMQIYTDDMLTINCEEKETNVALDEVWKRVIDVTFNSIYKSLHRNEVEDINSVFNKH